MRLTAIYYGSRRISEAWYGPHRILFTGNVYFDSNTGFYIVNSDPQLHRLEGIDLISNDQFIIEDAGSTLSKVNRIDLVVNGLTDLGGYAVLTILGDIDKVASLSGIELLDRGDFVTYEVFPIGNSTTGFNISGSRPKIIIPLIMPASESSFILCGNADIAVIDSVRYKYKNGFIISDSGNFGAAEARIVKPRENSIINIGSESVKFSAYATTKIEPESGIVYLTENKQTELKKALIMGKSSTNFSIKDVVTSPSVRIVKNFKDSRKIIFSEYQALGTAAGIVCEADDYIMRLISNRPGLLAAKYSNLLPLEEKMNIVPFHGSLYTAESRNVSSDSVIETSSKANGVSLISPHELGPSKIVYFSVIDKALGFETKTSETIGHSTTLLSVRDVTGSIIPWKVLTGAFSSMNLSGSAVLTVGEDESWVEEDGTDLLIRGAYGILDETHSLSLT